MATDPGYKENQRVCRKERHTRGFMVAGANRDDIPVDFRTAVARAPPSPIDPKTGTPVGIDKGWDYNAGEAAWGENHQKRLLEDRGPWRDLYQWGPEKYVRPERIAVDRAVARFASPVKKGDREALRRSLRRAVGGDEAIFYDPQKQPVRVPQAITAHMLEKKSRLDGREAYFPFLKELIEDPYEIWVNFARSDISGRVAVRRRYMKAVRLEKDQVIGLYAEMREGYWVGGNVFR